MKMEIAIFDFAVVISLNQLSSKIKANESPKCMQGLYVTLTTHYFFTRHVTTLDKC